MEKVTGIGGFFFRAKDPAMLNAWYAEHLGIAGEPVWSQEAGVTVFDDEWRCDLAAVDVGAVRTLEVDNDELAVLEHDPSMTLGHVPFGQDDVVALDTPNGHLCFVELKAALVSAFFGDDKCKHWALPATLRLTT